MIERVETGHALWTDEDGQPIARDETEATDRMIQRHALDSAEARARFGRFG